MNEFFLVTLPGLEDVVLAELKDWYPTLEAKIEHGGVTVEASLKTGLTMNLVLKTPTRILMRLRHFRCRDFPKFYNKILSVDWSEWLDPSSRLEVHASSRLSRLKIKSRIEDTTLDAWRAYQKKVGVKENPAKTATLYIRFVNDECTVSLDTSGERLHKRGQRQHIGEAPLRETIAAAMIQMVGRGHADAGEVEVVDPMMGSGTFLLESAGRDALVDQRHFAFESFKETPENYPALAASRPKIVGLTGFEQDAKAMAAAKTNLESIQKGVRLNLQAEDFFHAAPMPEGARPRWVFANPPYGERLKVDEPLIEFYQRLFAACETKIRPARACFILPSKAVKGRFLLPPGWKVLEKRPFVNGGIPVVAFVFGRNA